MSEKDLLQTVQRLGEALTASDLVFTWAKKIVQKAYKCKLHQGRHPNSIPAAALSVAGKLSERYSFQNLDNIHFRSLDGVVSWSYKIIAQTAGLSAQTVRKRVKEIWQILFKNHQREPFSSPLVSSKEDPTLLVHPNDLMRSPPFQIKKWSKVKPKGVKLHLHDPRFVSSVIVLFSKRQGGCAKLRKLIEEIKTRNHPFLDLDRFPIRLREGNLVFIACNGYIQGAFEAIKIELKLPNEAPVRDQPSGKVYLNNWKELTSPIKYRGTRYRYCDSGLFEFKKPVDPK